MRTVKTILAALCLAIALGVLQGCTGLEVKPASEFPYQRNWNPPA